MTSLTITYFYRNKHSIATTCQENKTMFDFEKTRAPKPSPFKLNGWSLIKTQMGEKGQSKVGGKLFTYDIHLCENVIYYRFVRNIQEVFQVIISIIYISRDKSLKGLYPEGGRGGGGRIFRIYKNSIIDEIQNPKATDLFDHGLGDIVLGNKPSSVTPH